MVNCLWRRVSLLCAALLIFVCCGARAAEPTIPKEINPEAKKVVDAYAAYLIKLKGFKVTVATDLSIEQPGKPAEKRKFVQKFNIERPNKLNWQAESPQGGLISIVSDGTDLALLIAQLQKFAVEKAPPSLQVLADSPLFVSLMGSGNALPLTLSLLSDSPAEELLEKTEVLEYGGKVMLDKVPCHLIKSSGGELDWQVWIDAGDKPLPVQFVPDLSKAFARMARQAKGKSPFENLKATNIVSLKNWESQPKFADDTFVFKAPENIEEARTFMGIFGRDEEEEQDSPPHPLLGKPAPEVKLDLLDGGKLDLASNRGKKIVILDFWATWCGPCRKAMPIIEKVVEKYKSKGVALYAVNLEESAEDIQEFLKDSGLKLQVALDKNGAVAKTYEASSIPQTVIVGKDGTVQVVKVGLSEELEEELTQDLEALLAGKNLAAEALAAAEENSKGDDGKGGDKEKNAKTAPKGAAPAKPAVPGRK